MAEPIPASHSLPAHSATSATPEAATGRSSRPLTSALRKPSAGTSSRIPPRADWDPPDASRFIAATATPSTGPAAERTAATAPTSSSRGGSTAQNTFVEGGESGTVSAANKTGLQRVFGEVLASLGCGGEENGPIDLNKISRDDLAALFANGIRNMDIRAAGAGATTANQYNGGVTGAGLGVAAPTKHGQRKKSSGATTGQGGKGGRRPNQRLAPSPEVSHNGSLSGREHSR
jgi:hypothetical protein